ETPPIPMADSTYLDENPDQLSEMQSTVKIVDRLITLIEQQLDQFGGNPWFALMPLAGVVSSVLARHPGAETLLDGAAQLLRDNPDKFSMFGEVKRPDQIPPPGAAEYQSFRDALEGFTTELEQAETPEIVIMNALVTTYMNI